MTLLPIFERELRVRARRRAGHWARFGIALVAFLVCLPQLLMSGPFGTPGSFGKGAFDGIVMGGFLLSCGACFLTATAISSEHQEGTLGLLFLTRVNTLDVLLGKFGSVGLTSFCSLLAFVPVMLVPVLAGGVTGGEAFRKGLALVATLSFALAIGLWASVLTPRTGAVRNAFGTTLLLVVLPYLLWHFGPSDIRGFGMFSPLVCVIAAGDVAYKSGPLWFWGSAFGVMALAALVLLGAAWRLRQVVFREVETVISSPVTFAPPGNSSVSGAAGAAPFRRCLEGEEASPVAWLVQRQPGLQARLWTAALLTLVHTGVTAVLSRWMIRGGGFSLWAFYWFPGLVASGLTSALVVWAASRFFIEGRRNAELEVLVTTPVGARTVVTEQWKVLRRLLRGPVLVMLLPFVYHWLIIFQVLPGPAKSQMPEYRLQFVVSSVLSITGLFLHLAALCWVGLWFGFKARSQASAILWAVCLATVGPYLLNLVLFGLLNVLVLANLGLRGATGWTYAVSWFSQLTGLLFNVGLLLWARGRLMSAVAGAAPGRFSLQESLATAARETASAFRRARSWTPS